MILEDLRRDILGLVPVLLVPLLEHGDRRPAICTLSSMFSVSPGNVKFEEPTSANEPTTSSRAWVM